MKKMIEKMKKMIQRNVYLKRGDDAKAKRLIQYYNKLKATKMWEKIMFWRGENAYGNM